MRSLAAAGNRAGALRHATVHRQLLQAELETGADPDVEALAEELRREAAAPVARPDGGRGRSAADALSQPDISAPPPPATPAATPAALAEPTPQEATSSLEAARPAAQAPGAEAGRAAFTTPVPPLPAVALDSARTNRRATIWLAAAVASAAVIVTAAAVLTLASSWDRLQWPLVVSSEPPTVAVLPPEDATPEKDEESLGLLIAEHVTRAVASDHLNLVSRTFAARGRAMDAKQIGREYRATLVFSGSYARDGDSIHVSVELASTRDNLRVWGGTYDCALSAMGGLANVVAQDVVTYVKDPCGGSYDVRRAGDQCADAPPPATRS